MSHAESSVRGHQRPHLMAQQQAGGILPKRTVTLDHHTFTIVTFYDRRLSSQSTQPMEMMFQAQLERYLFRQEAIGQTGAFYRLLQRAGLGGRSLALRRSSVAQGLLSDEEFDELRNVLHTGFRVFTLVPMDAVQVLSLFQLQPTHSFTLRSPLNLRPLPSPLRLPSPALGPPPRPRRC